MQHFIGRYSRYSQYQAVFLKLQEISSYLICKKLCYGRAFVLCRVVELIKNWGVLFTLSEVYAIIQLLDTLESVVV